jgi:hypothetical protein
MRLALCLFASILCISMLPPVSAEDDLPFDPEIAQLIDQVDSGEREERRSALDTLFGRKDDGVTNLVFSLLNETKKEEVIQDILRAIGKHKVAAGYEKAIKHLTHKKPGVRSFAAVCLERLENAEAKKDLLKRAGKEKDLLALKNALRALGIIGKNEADAGKTLIKRFSHKENIVAANAVLACGAFTEEGKVRSMVAARVGSLLSKTSDIRIRSACLCTIGAIGTKKELPELDKLKKSLRGNPNPLARGAIAIADAAIDKIKTGSTDEIGSGAFSTVYKIASDDERDPARDGDPEKEVPAWLGGDNRKGGGWRGKGR